PSWICGKSLTPNGSWLTVRADDAMAELYQAHFEGPVPSVAAKDGVVTIRYPRRLLVLGREKGRAVVALSVAIPWWIVIQGGASEITANLFLSRLPEAGLRTNDAHLSCGVNLQRRHLGGFSPLHGWGKEGRRTFS